MKKTIIKTIALLSITTVAFPIHSSGNKINIEMEVKIKSDKEEIKKAVEVYVAGGDQQDVSLLQTVMHDNYRVIINDTKENAIKELDKSTYLDFIGKKVFGGDPRKIEIESIQVSQGLNAVVKLKMTSSKAVFYSQFSLVKSQQKWWLVQDLAYMEVK